MPVQKSRKTPSRRGEAVNVTRDDGAHGGELTQLLRRRLGVGAEVEHVRVAMGGRDGGDDGGPLHTGQRLEHEVRDRVQRAGVAGADAGGGAPALHELHRDAHGRVLLAADRLARRLAHPHDLAGAHHFDACAHGLRKRRQPRLDEIGVAHEERAQLRVLAQGAERSGNVFGRRMIAAHHVDGDRQHGRRAAALSARRSYSFSSVSAGFSMTRRPR